MNAADRKLVTEYLATVGKFGELPYGLTTEDMDRRDRELSGRLITVTGDAAFIADTPGDSMPGEAGALMLHRMGNATRRMREAMVEPLPYTPEPPEYADLCVCGNRRGEHLGDDHAGIWALAKSYPDRYKCPGFTSATTSERPDHA